MTCPVTWNVEVSGWGYARCSPVEGADWPLKLNSVENGICSPTPCPAGHVRLWRSFDPAMWDIDYTVEVRVRVELAYDLAIFDNGQLRVLAGADGIWHTYRIDVHPSRGVYTMYRDGQLVTLHRPLPSSTPTGVLSIGNRDISGAVEAYVDWVEVRPYTPMPARFSLAVYAAAPTCGNVNYVVCTSFDVWDEDHAKVEVVDAHGLPLRFRTSVDGIGGGALHCGSGHISASPGTRIRVQVLTVNDCSAAPATQGTVAFISAHASVPVEGAVLDYGVARYVGSRTAYTDCVPCVPGLPSAGGSSFNVPPGALTAEFHLFDEIFGRTHMTLTQYDADGFVAYQENCNDALVVLRPQTIRVELVVDQYVLGPCAEPGESGGTLGHVTYVFR